MQDTMSNKVAHLEFLNRENSVHHHSYEEDMLPYEYVKLGDMRSLDACKKVFQSGNIGHLSEHPLRNRQYLFVCSVTLATRFAIEGGMDPERAYNASDLFIQRVDKTFSIDEVMTLQMEMLSFYTKQVQKNRTEHIYSKPVILCMDFIYYHLHENITVQDMANHLSLNRSYLSKLFHKETGFTLIQYISMRRMEAAENMLKYSDYSITEISAYVGYADASHFSYLFKKSHRGVTPTLFRKENFRANTLSIRKKDVSN